MKPSPLFTSSLLLSALSWSTIPCSAIKLRLNGKRTPRYEFHGVGVARETVTYDKRGSLQGSSPLNNSADISYYTELTLGGQSFEVLIDTGSSDLWVAGTVPGATDTGKSSGVTYAIGQVQGPIKLADLSFAGFTVSKQAYLEISPDSSNPEGQGLIGLGPVVGSNIYSTIPTNQGLSVLDRIFLQNTSTPNYLTVLLGREDDPTDIFSGDLSIGETLTSATNVSIDLSSITNQPKLDVTIVSTSETGNQHFQVLLDTDGLYGPDNKSVTIETDVDETKNDKQLTAVVDTGFSLSQLPSELTDAIYGRISGATFSNVTGIGATWLIPCNQEVNITFKMGGVRYPIHPMDVALDPDNIGLSGVPDISGEKACIGAFQPFSFNAGADKTYDMILGMSFVRNVYALFDFGDFTGNGQEKGDPYIQFLSTTDPAQAHADFVKVRLNGVDTTGSQVLGAPLSSSSNKSSSSSTPRIVYLALGIAAIVLAVGIVIGTVCLCRRRSGKQYKGSAKPAMWGMGSQQGAYKPIGEQGMPLNNINNSYEAGSYANASSGNFGSNYQYANASGGMGYGMGGQGFEPKQPLYDPPTVPPPASSAPPMYAPPAGPPPPGVPQGPPPPTSYENPFEPHGPRR